MSKLKPTITGIALVLLSTELAAQDTTIEYSKSQLLYKVFATYKVRELGTGSYKIDSVAGATTPLGRFGLELENISRSSDYSPLRTTVCEQDPTKSDEKCYSYKFLGEGRYLYQRHDNIRKSLTDVAKLTEGQRKVKIFDASRRSSFIPGRHILHDPSSLILAVLTLGLSPNNPTYTTYVVSGGKVRKIVLHYQGTTMQGWYKIKMDVLEGERKSIPTFVILDPNYKGSGKAVIQEIHGQKPLHYMIPLKRASGL